MFLPPLLSRLLIRTGFVRLLPGLQRRLQGGAEFLRYYSDRLLASPLTELEQLGDVLEASPPDVIDLTGGSPHFDSVPTMPLRLPAERRGWPCFTGLPELRGAVAAKLLGDNGLALSPAEEILITAGALGAMQTILDAFVNRGDRVVLLDPCSPMYPLLVRSRGASIHWVGTRTDEGRLRLRFDHLARGMNGARLLVINSPHNPTGASLSAEDLEQIVWWANRCDALIASDEVYDRYSLEEQPISIATLTGARQRSLTIGSVSKRHALTWARVGWIAAHRHLLRPCLATAALRNPFVATSSQLIALSALRGRTDGFESLCQQLQSRREYASSRLAKAGLDAGSATAGFFIWVRVPMGWQSGRSFAEALRSGHRVRVLPGDLFGPSAMHHIRISLLAEDGRLDEGLARIVQLAGGEPQRRRGFSVLRRAG